MKLPWRSILLLTIFTVTAAAQQPSRPITMQRLWALDSTYIDPAHGVSFRYPSVWKPGISFGYHPPALSYDDDHKPTAGFGFDTGKSSNSRTGPYGHSNLEGFGVVYRAQPVANSVACEKLAASFINPDANTKVHEVVIAGVTYSVRGFETAGMSQSTEGPIYATFRAGACFLFELVISEFAVSISGGEADSDPHSWPPVDKKVILAKLQNIMETVRYSPTVSGRPISH